MPDGNWTCPSAACANVNFAHREECNRCKTARPQASGRAVKPAGGAAPGGYGGMGGAMAAYGAAQYGMGGGIFLAIHVLYAHTTLLFAHSFLLFSRRAG